MITQKTLRNIAIFFITLLAGTALFLQKKSIEGLDNKVSPVAQRLLDLQEANKAKNKGDQAKSRQLYLKTAQWLLKELATTHSGKNSPAIFSRQSVAGGNVDMAVSAEQAILYLTQADRIIHEKGDAGKVKQLYLKTAKLLLKELAEGENHDRAIHPDQAEIYLGNAEKSDLNGDKEEAEQFYLTAALWLLGDEEENSFMKEAATAGHRHALERVLDNLFFTAGYDNEISGSPIERASPSLALDIYRQAKKANPSLQINGVETMEMCAAAGKLDINALIKKYPLENENRYGVWELAEEASREGRFGSPNSQLVLQLVCRGGPDPHQKGAMMRAVSSLYNNWKSGVIKEFNICNSLDFDAGDFGSAMYYCEEHKQEKEILEGLKKLSSGLDKNIYALMVDNYRIYKKYIDAYIGEADVPNGLSASGHQEVVLSVTMDAKDSYLKRIKDVKAGFIPKPKQNFLAAQEKLNQTYLNFLAIRKECERKVFEKDLMSDEIQNAQVIWDKYRDSSAKLFKHLNPSVDENTWKIWLTEYRVANLLEAKQDWEERLHREE